MQLGYFAFFAWGATLSAAELKISPAVIFDCQNGAASATVTWSGASGPVDVRILQASGPSMTGTVGASGSASTGLWVSDGMQFFLVNASGIAEATATAKVRCGGSASTLDTGLAGGSYFPLQVGNTWVYRFNTRGVTNEYLVRTIVGTEILNGKTYYLLSDGTSGAAGVLMRLRGDGEGVIWQWKDGAETAYIDPRTMPVRGAYPVALGRFDDSLAISAFQGLASTTTIFVRGLGLASSKTNLATGSSGGFYESMDLIEARLAGVTVAFPARRLGLSIEDVDLDVTGMKAPNCAVPCYFAACGFAPGSDPPGTYRPCVQARVETSVGSPHSVELQLLDSSGAVVYTKSAEVAGADSLQYVRVPLYSSGAQFGSFTVLPAGSYKLLAKVVVGGVEASVDSISVRVR